MTNVNVIDEMREAMRDLNRTQPINAPEAITLACAIIDAETEPLSDAPMAGNLKPGTRRNYVLAGNATFTIRSTKTGERFTFKVQKGEPTAQYPNPMTFVKVLVGPQNESDYRYIGAIKATGFMTTSKSAFGMNTPCVKAFGWFSTHMESAAVEVWHTGKCGRCGRTLTVPESIETGIGPVCLEK